MPLFQKIPVVIEAIQFTGTEENMEELESWMGEWFLRWEYLGRYLPEKRLIMKTLEGNEFNVGVGWWILQGVKGEMYACEPAIFELSYEPAPWATLTAYAASKES